MSEGIRAGFCTHYPEDGIIATHAACWRCMTSQCPGGWHTWADADDVEFATMAGKPDPSDQKCGCVCADGPILEPEQPEFEEVHDVPPCEVCGELGACAYDSEGRPMIHSVPYDD